VKDPVDFLPGEGPHGDAVAKDADVAGDEDEQALEDPLEDVLGRSLAAGVVLIKLFRSQSTVKKRIGVNCKLTIAPFYCH
jgi:hypothetical protein